MSCLSRESFRIFVLPRHLCLSLLTEVVPRFSLNYELSSRQQMVREAAALTATLLPSSSAVCTQLLIDVYYRFLLPRSQGCGCCTVV